MKNGRILCILLLVAGSGISHLCAQSRIIESPPFETRSQNYCTVSRIERTPQATRLTIHTEGKPKARICIARNFCLRDAATGEKWLPTAIEGTTFDEWFPIPESGRMDFILTYPPLPETVEKADWIENDGAGFCTFGISLSPQRELTKTERILSEARGNWLRQNGSNEWVLGLYDSIAVFDNQLWKYRNIRSNGKKLDIEAVNDRGDTRRVRIKPAKQGQLNVRIGSRKAETLGRKATAWKRQTDRVDKKPFFRPGKARLQGYLKGYAPQLGFKTGIIYLNNEITREDFPTVVSVEPDGRFYCELNLNHPISSAAFFQRERIPFYLEPGDTATLFVDWEEILDRTRFQDYNRSLPQLRHMGPTAQIARIFPHLNSFTDEDWSVYQNQLKQSTPDQYLGVRDSILKRQQARLDSLEATGMLTPATFRTAQNHLRLSHGYKLLDFTMYRDMFAKRDTLNPIYRVKETPEYYRFLREMPLNDPATLADDAFGSFINRFEYMNPLDGKKQKPEPVDKSIPQHEWWLRKMLKEKREKEERLSEYLQDSLPLAWDIACIRKLEWALKTIEDRTSARRYLDSTLSIIREPFLRAEGERIFNAVYPEKEAKPYELPAGKGSDIFRRIIAPYHGKYLLVDFWGIFCGPCRSGIEQSAPLREQYKNHPCFRFVFITSESESPTDRYNEFVSKNGIGETSHRISDDDYLYLRELFRFNGIPRYILVDPEGRIMDDDFNHWELESKLKQLLPEDPTASHL